MSNKKAQLLLRERLILSAYTFVEIVVWQLPRPLRGSTHPYKYRLAYIVDEVCVLRFDNESGKGDHYHLNGIELPYSFVGLQALQTAFWEQVNLREELL